MELFQRKLEIKTCLSRTYPVVIYVFFRVREDWGLRLRRARGIIRRYEGKRASLFFSLYLPMRPHAPQPNPKSSLTLKTHVNSDWARV